MNMEKVPSQEKLRGKNYKTVEDLQIDINKNKERNFDALEQIGDDSIHIPIVRIWAKELAKFESADGKQHWELTDGSDNKFVAGSIFQIKENEVSFNFHDWRDHKISKKPPLISWLRITNKDIESYRLEPAIKKVKINK